MLESRDELVLEELDLRSSNARRKSRIETWFGIARHTLREPIKRFSGHLAILVVIAVGVWAARMGFDTLPVAAANQNRPSNEPEPTIEPTPMLELSDLPLYAAGGPVSSQGITRSAVIHTVLPDRPRLDIIKYVVQSGDTLFGIAEKFGIKPESLLWANFAVLQDDPHRLRPGQELNVPPVNGVLHVWSAGEGLNGVAEYYGVTAQDVIDWPGNKLEPGIDTSNPPIESGTLLVIPGGKREIVTWSAPRIRRDNPAVAKVLGPGACGSVYDGPIGTGVFIWPAPSHYLSGYGYSSVHPAIDIAGDTGNAIFASDSGVVVYSGWNDWGYGYVIVLDHGNGWQTLYAHLSAINVGCGQAIFQGQVIGGLGNTGNSSGSHLHFEIEHEEYGKVNPLNYLP
ncbi:MAG: peptidoglycan DD-metalloendopeptidase family protein [Anaerolineales bacterium]|nr:peptidoglycan DD-metalloendopeptidase family protein [Anaerolineales bacterium]